MTKLVEEKKVIQEVFLNQYNFPSDHENLILEKHKIGSVVQLLHILHTAKEYGCQ